MGFLALVTLSALMARSHGANWIIGAFVGLLVMSNILANKIISFWKFAVPAGVIAYAATFLLTDMLNEFYGKKTAKKAVWIGFYASILALIALLIAIYLPPADFWAGQEKFASVLGNTTRIVLASMIAYIVSQNYDVWLYNLLKKKTKSKHLWLRNNASTMSSQLIDTVLFISVAFYGLFPIVPMIIGHAIIKISIAVIDTPFMYLSRYFYYKHR